MSDTKTEDPIDDKPMPLLDHLLELRQRMMWSIVAFFVAFLVCYYFSAQIYSFLAKPLADVLKAQGGQDAPHLFFTHIKLAMFGALFVAFPVIASQLWLFIAPGLYRSEKHALLPFLAATPILFLMGAALAYYFVFPFAWKFFASFQTQTGAGGIGIELLPRVGEYLDLVMRLIIAL